ncbi:MAG: right-handed parallel beta-helix repeat-containing protein, partial [Verrucomicrobiales bacterium]
NVAVAGDTVHLRAGTYRETVTPANDGAAGSPIVFRPYQNETVVISGSDALSGWTDIGGGIWEAPMNWSMVEYRNQLFVNGVAMTKARWPNVADNDPITPEGALFELAGSNMQQARAQGGFPGAWTSASLDGAAIWVMAQAKWRAWNSAITGYDPATGIASFTEVTQSWYAGNMNPATQGPYGDGYFYLSGSLGLLDAPGEWWRDDANAKMLLIPPAGVDPTDAGTEIEAKRRDYGFNLDNREHIHLEDLILRGTAASLEGARFCRLTRLSFYDFDFREGATHVSPGPFYRAQGVLISGQGNVVRDSEFTRCTDAAVTILGEDNALINCYLHEVDYGGYDGGPINLGGRRNLVSHNTVERTSRKGINPSGLGHLIQYNFVKEIGLVTRDQAAIYAGGSSPGGNTVIRYNWVNVGNGNPESSASGIYMDNWHKNVVIHHNIVWNVTNGNGNGLQPNRPGHYDLWVHNSVEGNVSTNYGPWQGQETLYGTFLHNNWSTGSIDTGNYAWSKLGNFQAPLNLSFVSGIPLPNADTSGRDAGSFLPGINDGYAGSAPDIGAIENGVLDWSAGHNFASPPSPAYEPAAFYYRSYVLNGGFDYQRVDYTPRLDRFYGWTQTGLAASSVEYFPGFNFPAADQRNSLHANSVHLQGAIDDGVEQTIPGLPMGRFEFAAYVRLVTPASPGADVRLSVVRNGQEIAGQLATTVSLSGSQAWRLVKVPFTQYAAGDVAVRITKLGDGEAYVDNIGLVPRYFDDPFNIPPLPVSDLPAQNGLLLHLDASKIFGLADGDPLDAWIDQSGGGNDGSAAGAQRPVFIEN